MVDSRLRGVNIGGWLLMEGYLLGGRNIPECEFKRKFRRIYGNRELDRFENCFYNNFITEDDIRHISLWGANCIRIPFNFRLFGTNPSSKSKGFCYLDKILSFSKKYKLKVILDLHATYGGQNPDWHADNRGKACLWGMPSLQKKTYKLWEIIATRYKEEDYLYGYDVLNEPVVDKEKLPILKKFYSNIIERIRKVDKKHIIFLEGNLWAQQIDFLKDLLREKVNISIHTYQPLNFTFNFNPNVSYPGLIDKVMWDKNRIRKYLNPYYEFSRRYKVNIFVGEFGINYRKNCAGELTYLNDILEIFEEYAFSYTYWTYKAVYGFIFPNGIYQYLNNSPFIKREGPVYGWENYLKLWKSKKKEIISFWKTDNFYLNKRIVDILRKFFRLSSFNKSKEVVK